MAKKYLDQTVYEAALERIAYLFDEFDRVLVAFSGGKDSGVALEMCYDYAAEHGCLDRLGVYFLDYEAQFGGTVDYIADTYERMSDIDRFWLCLPVAANFAPVAGESWYPWDPDERENWLREYPDGDYLITPERAAEIGFKYRFRQSAGSVRKAFGKWYAKRHGTTAVVVGLRADESLNRYRAIAARKYTYKEQPWISSVVGDVATAYPIYDWTTEDVWHYYAVNAKPYSPMYDACYRAGMAPRDIREVYPFCFYGTNSIKLYKAIEPDLWARIVLRCPAANFAAIYGDTEAMGYKKIVLPDGYTWKTYFEHLLATLPEKQSKHYAELMERRVSACEPDELNTMYRTMCVCVLRNDWKAYNGSSAVAKQKVAKRKAAVSKWKAAL